jgi:hypothetical protein
LGIIGVALGTTVPMLGVRLLLQPRYTCKVMGIEPREYWSMFGGNSWRTCVALAIPVGLAVAYKPVSYPQLGVAVTLAALTYGSTAWFLLFTPEERTKLATLWPASQKASAAPALV